MANSCKGELGAEVAGGRGRAIAWKTAARLAIGAGRASGLENADAEQAIAFRRRPWVPWALIALALLMFVAVSFALLGVVHYADVPNELKLASACHRRRHRSVGSARSCLG